MKTICVIGLGYVGLPLAVEFGKVRSVIGYDKDEERITQLKKRKDRTREISKRDFENAKGLRFTSNPRDISKAEIIIVSVPTPIDKYKKPDLNPLILACKQVGKYFKKGSIVIFESTVYPGCTEEVCVPAIESVSGLKFNRDFYCGYSPERINPGDKVHRLPQIKKITSGSTTRVANEVDRLYKEIITEGTHKTSSIRVAEAAKVIENAQRDLNIAFVNELALIFDKMDIDTREVLEAAETKWNFLPFKPGLVGGHCIGVDPYYLTHKAEAIGYHPEVILAGRKINDSMGAFVASKVVKLMISKGSKVKGSNILILGITFKENCPDIRNSKVIDVIHELKSFGAKVAVHDPQANSKEVKEEYDITLTRKINRKYDAVILAVAHKEFENIKLKSLRHRKTIVFDIKSIFDKKEVSSRL